MHHGAAVARLLREVALRDDDGELVEFLDRWLADRLPLIDQAERAVSWFADHPHEAIHSGV